MPRLLKPALAVVAAIAVSLAAGGQPPVKWIPPPRRVPRAKTAVSPALAVLAPPGGTLEAALFWAGPRLVKSGFEISYQTSVNLPRDVWSPTGTVGGGALTGSRPSATQFGKLPAASVIVAFAGATDHKIRYSIGVIGKKGTLSWPHGPVVLPGAFTSTGPTVFSVLHSGDVFLAWAASNTHRVDYVVGRIAGRSIIWGEIAHIPGALATAAPAVSEASTSGAAGRIYVLWRRPNSGLIAGAATADPLSGHQAWTPISSAIQTGAAPAATAIGANGSYPLLVVYRAPKGSQLLYATINAAGPLTHKASWTVPKLSSQVGGALIPGILAATDPGNVDYEPFVRVCAGCR